MMNKIFIFCYLFVFTQTFLFSQKYQPFDSTTVWGANQIYKVCTNCYLNRDIKYFSKGFELNNGRQWNKLYFNDITTFYFCTTCTTTYLPPNTNQLSGYYWNDTINKKVYFYNYTSLPPNFNPSSCYILYDFNKTVGDTLTFKQFCNKLWDFKVVGIDSILFSGKYHKRFLTTAIPTAAPINSQLVAFTEGIGSSLGPFEPMVNVMGEQYSYLKCFASPSQTMTVTNYTVFGSGTCTYLTLDVNEYNSLTNGNLFPNPNNGTFQLNFNEANDGIIILYNSLGQKVHEQYLHKGLNNITKTDLSKGIYSYIILQDKKTISNGRLAIQ